MAVSVKSKVLVLGAGLVSAPAIDYLLRQNYDVTVVSALKTDLEKTLKRFPDASAVHLDVIVQLQELNDLVTGHDVVLSLLPANLTFGVVQMCIEYRKHFVAPNYVDSKIKHLGNQAMSANVTLLLECGLDPGIDHMIAMECIDGIKETGGKIKSFTSWCGGLPAPECSHNKLRYKVSWYPKGMLESCMRQATYLKNTQKVQIAGGQLSSHVCKIDGLLPGEDLVGAPNGNALNYAPVYGIESADTVFRGTIRYQNFYRHMDVLIKLGYLSSLEGLETKGDDQLTWKEFLCKKLSMPYSATRDDIRKGITTELGNDDAPALLEELGVLSDDRMPIKRSVLDAFSELLSRKLAFGVDERDLVLMRNIVVSQSPDGQEKKATTDLIQYGRPDGFSAMAITTGLTAAISASLLVKGVIQTRGLVIPAFKDVYSPILSELRNEGIIFKKYVN